MMIAKHVKSLLAAAHKENLPFALWRRPQTVEFEAVISCAPPSKRPVFSDIAEQNLQPFFAMAPFVTADGNTCTAIPADILIASDLVRFFDGKEYRNEPVTETQQDLKDAPLQQGLQASKIAVVPTQMHCDDYQLLVQKTVDHINSGICQKIVLSRVEARDLPDHHDLFYYVEQLAKAYPNAFIALASSQETGTWLVATPEVLLSVDDDTIETMALAGTQWSNPDMDMKSLVWPQKIIVEQSIVADYIREAFEACGVDNLHETAAHTVKAADIYHLRSEFTAPMRNLAREAVGELLNKLHPTPAVSGTPRPEAMQFLDSNEEYNRNYYTGYLGPVNLNGRTELFVNLRSAQLSDKQIFLYIGGGIVEGSDPATEWEETVQKTATIAKVL